MNSPAKVPAYEGLAQDIKALGAETVFGLMSDDTALLVSTLDAMGVRFLAARHENNAISAAEGYASATGQVGIAIIGRGPAAANSVHGAGYAARSGSKVLVIYGDPANGLPPVNGLGPDTKSFSTAAVLQAAGLRVFTADHAAGARSTLALAYQAAQRGATALLLPMNVQFGLIDLAATAPAPLPSPLPQPAPARAAAIEAAAALLAKSRKPLIVAGLGAHRAGAREVLVALADKIGAGLVTSLKAKDLFRGHPLDGGVIGSFSHAGGRRLIEQADCILVVGAGLNLRTTSYGTSLPDNIPLIQVDSVRTNIGRWFHADVAVVADVKKATEQLLDALPERAAADKPLHSEEMKRWLADFDMASEFQAQNTPRTLDPRVAGIEFDKVLPEDRNLVYDSGNFLQIAPFVGVKGPAHWKIASDFSSIGMGFGAAIGFAAGTPDRTTVFFVGDGSFLMNLGELETVAREGVPLAIVVMNDCAYGAELHYLKMRDMPIAKSVFLDIDFAPVAEAFGFETATVRTVEELRALAPLLAAPSGPILIDCKINAAVAAPFLLESVEAERKKA